MQCSENKNLQVKNKEQKRIIRFLKNCLLGVKRKLALLLILKIPTIKKAVKLLNSIGVLKLTAINFKKTNIMKKMVFGIIATVMLSVCGNAQTKETKENARLKLATATSMIVDNYRESFKKTMTYDDFLHNVVLGGIKNSTLKTPTADNLIKKTYTYLKNGTVSSEIIKNDNGAEMADVLYLINKSNSLEEGATSVFGEEFCRIQWPPRWLSWIWDNREELIDIICMFTPLC